MLAIGRCGKRSSQNERRSKPQISCKTSSCPMILEHKKSASVDSLPIIALGMSGVVILAMDSRLAFPNPQGYPQRLQLTAQSVVFVDLLSQNFLLLIQLGLGQLGGFHRIVHALIVGRRRVVGR